MVDMGWQHFRGQALGCMIGVLLLGCGQGSTQEDGFREQSQALKGILRLHLRGRLKLLSRVMGRRAQQSRWPGRIKTTRK